MGHRKEVHRILAKKPFRKSPRVNGEKKIILNISKGVVGGRRQRVSFKTVSYGGY
jgi:hypothetical protein